MQLSGSKAGLLSLALWAIALRAEGHGPASRNDRRVNESAAVARSHKLILACEDESATGACEMLPLEDTLGVYDCLHMVGGRSAGCEAQLTVFRDIIMKPPPSAGMYMYAGYADVSEYSLDSSQSSRYAEAAEYSGDSSESSEDYPERSNSESSDSWEEALSSDSDFDSESSDFVSHRSESRGRAEKQKLNNMEEKKVAHVFWPFSVSSDSTSSDSTSSDSVSSESSDSESSDSESSYSVASLKDARVHAAKQKLHNMEKKSPHVDGPGLRKSHGLRGHNGGTSESSHSVHGMIGGTHGIHRFRDPSDTSFNDRHHGHYGYHGKGDHHRHHGCHVFVYAFIGLCLLLQVAIPLVLWRRRRQALARQSGTAGGATSPAEPASSSATTTTRGGEYQPLVNANGTAASDDDDDDDIVVTGTPINPPPSAHV